MACEAMISTSSRPIPADPYVFTEPPAIQTLQLQKTAIKGKAALNSSGVTGSSKHRHNTTESLKKKLGITGKSFMHAKTIAAHMVSPMISGRSGRVVKRASPLTDTSLQLNNRRVEKSERNHPQKEAKVPRKYTKRTGFSKKTHELELFQMADDALDFDRESVRDPYVLPALHMRNWFVSQVGPRVSSDPRNVHSMNLSREEKLELKRCELRRRSIQLRSAQAHREIMTSRRRFLMVQSSLLQEPDANGVKYSRPFRVCNLEGCKNEALIFTAFCPLHITQCDEQQLFTPCTAMRTDNKSCRVPVFDISHKLPLCREHARRLEKSNKAPIQYRPKTENVISVRNGHISKTVDGKSPTPPSAIQKTMKMPTHGANHLKSDHMVPSAPHPVTQQPPKYATTFLRFGTLPTINPVIQEPDDFVDDIGEEDDEDSIGGGEDDSLLNKSSKKAPHVLKRKNYKQLKAVGVHAGRLNQTDVLLVSENSSAYESSEDTGVGGLSESEMIEEIGFDSRFLEDPEFNNVLEDLLAVEQHGEMFDAISVDDDVKTMEINGTSTFLGDFLADQMLKESEAAGHAQHIFVPPNETVVALHMSSSESLPPAPIQT